MGDDRLGARDGRGAYDLRLSQLAARLERRGAFAAGAVRGVDRDTAQIVTIPLARIASVVPAFAKPKKAR